MDRCQDDEPCRNDTLTDDHRPNGTDVRQAGGDHGPNPSPCGTSHE
jgi:hypothetical protein